MQVRFIQRTKQDWNYARQTTIAYPGLLQRPQTLQYVHAADTKKLYLLYWGANHDLQIILNFSQENSYVLRHQVWNKVFQLGTHFITSLKRYCQTRTPSCRCLERVC